MKAAIPETWLEGGRNLGEFPLSATFSPLYLFNIPWFCHCTRLSLELIDMPLYSPPCKEKTNSGCQNESE